MSFATDLLSGLTGFRDHLVNTAEEAAKPALAAVEAHIGRLLPLVETNVLAAEDEAKAILHELYGNLAGDVQAELSSAPPPTSSASAGSAAVAPAVVESDAQPTVAAEPGPEVTVPADSGVHVDPTAAPGTTTEGSSAPSSTPSASTTETPAAEAAPETPQA